MLISHLTCALYLEQTDEFSADIQGRRGEIKGDSRRRWASFRLAMPLGWPDGDATGPDRELLQGRTEK